MIHNNYRERGGEDISFDSEVQLLQNNGHRVFLYIKDNGSIADSNFLNNIRLFSEAIWSRSAYNDVSRFIRETHPDVVHVQNTFPLISPSVIFACRDNDVPVVQTIRNYRLLCPNALFFRNQNPCELCLGHTFPLPGILRGCYHESPVETAGVGLMLARHNLQKTWKKNVNTLITLTNFSRNKFIEAGYLEEKLVVKPNFIRDPGENNEVGDYALFTGRLSGEKGLLTLLSAWRKLGDIPLVIIGNGPLENEVNHAVFQNKNIKHLNHLSHNELILKIIKSKFVIFPSEWYETFGRVIIEANACSKPVIASRLGAMAELVRDGETGLLFKPGNAEDLADKVNRLWNSPELLEKMSSNCRAEYLAKFTAEKNYKQLMAIYHRAIALHSSGKVIDKSELSDASS